MGQWLLAMADFISCLSGLRFSVIFEGPWIYILVNIHSVYAWQEWHGAMSLSCSTCLLRVVKINLEPSTMAPLMAVVLLLDCADSVEIHVLPHSSKV